MLHVLLLCFFKNLPGTVMVIGSVLDIIFRRSLPTVSFRVCGLLPPSAEFASVIPEEGGGCPHYKAAVLPST